MQLDPDYLELVSQALGHSARAVQVVGLHTLKEIAEDPLSGRTLPSRLQVLAERLANQGIGSQESYPQEDRVHDSEEGAPSLLRNSDDPSSDSEAGPKPASDGTLRNPKQDRTVRSSRMNEVRTTARERGQVRAMPGVRLPDRFLGLKEEQQAGAMVALQQVDARYARPCWTNGRIAVAAAPSATRQATCSASSNAPSVASSTPGPSRPGQHRHLPLHEIHRLSHRAMWFHPR